MNRYEYNMFMRYSLASKWVVFVLCFAFILSFGSAKVVYPVDDSFEDGDYTSNPSWGVSNSNRFSLTSGGAFDGSNKLNSSIGSSEHIYYDAGTSSSSSYAALYYIKPDNGTHEIGMSASNDISTANDAIVTRISSGTSLNFWVKRNGNVNSIAAGSLNSNEWSAVYLEVNKSSGNSRIDVYDSNGNRYTGQSLNVVPSVDLDKFSWWADSSKASIDAVAFNDASEFLTDLNANFKSFASNNNSVSIRSDAIKELNFSTTTQVNVDGFDKNLLVKRPQYAKFDTEFISFFNPSGVHTSVYSVNASKNISEYPDGQYLYKWYIGDCPRAPDCSGAGDLLYNVSDVRRLSVKRLKQPSFNLFNPTDGADLVGVDQDFIFFVDSNNDGNVSVVVDGNRVVNSTHNGSGYIKFNESYSHVARGEHTWSVRLDTLVNGNKKTYRSSKLDYELIDKGDVSFSFVNPSNNEVVASESVYVIGEVGSNREGVMRLYLDGDQVASCSHGGSGVEGCASVNPVNVSIGNYEWYIEFEDNNTGEVSTSAKVNFSVISSEDKIASFSGVTPNDRVIGTDRPVNVSGLVDSNVRGSVEVRVNGSIVKFYTPKGKTKADYDPDGSDLFYGVIDPSDPWFSGAGVYEYDLVFTSDGNNFVASSENRTFIIEDGLVDSNIVDPDDGDTVSSSQGVNIQFKSYLNIPAGELLDDAVRHRVVVDGDYMANFSQFESGWREFTANLEVDESDYTVWIESFNSSSGKRLFKSGSVGFEVRDPKVPVPSKLINYILLQTWPQPVRLFLGTAVIFSVAISVGTLFGSLGFIFTMLFGIVFGSMLPNPWYPTWVVVLLIVLSGGVVLYSLK